jgi:hypothetical protein
MRFRPGVDALGLFPNAGGERDHISGLRHLATKRLYCNIRRQRPDKLLCGAGAFHSPGREEDLRA